MTVTGYFQGIGEINFTIGRTRQAGTGEDPARASGAIAGSRRSASRALFLIAKGYADRSSGRYTGIGDR